MAISYRNLNPGDYDNIIDVWEVSGLPARLKGRDSRENIAAHMKKQPHSFIGAFDGESLIGVVIATDDGRKGWINRLAVIPEYRGYGIARKLIRISEERLFNSGIGIISCLIMDDNSPSIGLFESEDYSSMREVLYFRKVLNEDV